MNFNKTLDNITIYEPGKPVEEIAKDYGIAPKDIIKLASNENPYGVSLKVKKAILNQIDRINQYPDDNMSNLKDSLCKKFDINQNNLIIGSGSDQILEFIVHSKCTINSNILMARTTFAMYEIYGNMVGANIIRTPSHTHILDEFLEIYKQNKLDIIFICTPNNPLGEALDNSEIIDFLKQIDDDTLVVIDGAYMEYAKFKDVNKAIEPKKITEQFSNVIYTGTFSKAYGLGGMRVGYGIASPYIIENLYKLRPPFNVGILSIYSADAALKDHDFIENSISKNFVQMKRFEQFANENNIEYINSYTNFLTFLLPSSMNAQDISIYFLENGIIIRSLLNSYKMNAIRVTIGTQEQNDKFLEIFKLGLK